MEQGPKEKARKQAGRKEPANRWFLMGNGAEEKVPLQKK